MDYSLFQGELPIVIVQEYEVSSFVMGYHDYRKTWVPFVGEDLQCRMEPDNVVDKYAVAVINKDRAGEREKRKACENCIIFPATRYKQFGKSGNYWESCEQRQRNGNASSMSNYIH